MSDYIPFDVHSEIIKWLPARSLLRFRTVSKEWKAHIDTNHTRRLLVSYELDNVRRYISIIDNNTVPLQMIPLTALESLSSLRKLITLASYAGLICFYGGVVDSNTTMAVIWNPTVRRSVGIDINPNTGYELTIVGFGVCHFDPKLVKISVKQNYDGIHTMWDVDVFSLSTRDWRNVHTDMQPPFRCCKLECAKVCVKGVIYFRAYNLDDPMSNFFISFNLESGAFGVVPFPGNLEHTPNYIQATKVNESLGILEYHPNDEGGRHVCTVWTRDHEAFNLRYTVLVEGHSLNGDVLGFRNNGEVVVELKDDDDNEESRIVAYVPLGPLAGHITGVGINGRLRRISARSYMETGYLSDLPEDIIIHKLR